MDNSNKLRETLREDLNVIAKRFISIYDLKYTENVSKLACPVTRWLDFRLRYVSPKPRKLVYSNKFPDALSGLDPDIRAGWDILAKKIEIGEDINPYQGKGLIRNNDTSDENPTQRTDLLWASWGVLHFHLTSEPILPNEHFSKRSSYQAFCAFDEDAVAVIDIRAHPRGSGYSDPDFLHIIAESWPYAMDHAELKGIMPGELQTADEIHRLRKVGVNTVINIKGKSYMNPAAGLTSAGTALNQQMYLIKINDTVRVLSDLIELDPVFNDHVSQAGVTNPVYGLTILQSGVSLYEEKSKIAFSLDVPSLPSLKLLQEDLFPKWALKKYAMSDFASEF